MTSVSSGNGYEARPDVFYYTNQIVNVVMIGDRVSGDWVLVDAGMPHSAEEIWSVAEARFNRGPRAIILTHGHFDHVGSIVGLLEKWEVPVYAHELEFPYLTGAKSYPEPDTSVEGGLLAKISFMDPVKPIDIREALLPLPSDGSVPELPQWSWIHTPGHSPGHISLFREKDHTLISGDAAITVRQDSFYKVLIQEKEINGPPRYLTTDWGAAWDSVRKLKVLAPEVMVPGHGEMMMGDELRKGLKELVEDFNHIAIPAHGRYVGNNIQPPVH
jgi:glyoxylase-like metal-dependent hydrolase (beta-lactamase superfamily II)